MTTSVLCPHCGTADVFPQRMRELDDAEYVRLRKDPANSGHWLCARCDRTFTPHPCPYCGSYAIDGAHGVSGAPYLQAKIVVPCWSCGEQFPAHSEIMK
jgi:predicted RNA-binding Zn-ribbon protein involved in translation (DUF1610 family)